MNYDISTSDLDPQRVVSIRARRAPSEVPELLATSFGALFGRLGLLGVEPAGPPLVIYHEFGADEIDAEVCVPVARDVPVTGSIQARVLPAATVAVALHVGPYEDLGAAYAALEGWIRQRGYETAGPFQERYLNGPGDGVTPSDYRTVVEVPVRPTGHEISITAEGGDADAALVAPKDLVTSGFGERPAAELAG